MANDIGDEVADAQRRRVHLHPQARPLISELLVRTAVAGANRAELTWANQVKPDEKWAGQVDASAGSPMEDWIAALAHTPVDCMSGALKLLKELRKLSPSREQFEEALFGPWHYRYAGNPYGLDPELLQLGEFTEDDPRLLSKKRPIVAGAIWLALNAVPFFPERNRPFTWCVWSNPLSAEFVKMLLASGIIEGEPQEARVRRGFQAAYQSERLQIKEGRSIRFALKRASLLP